MRNMIAASVIVVILLSCASPPAKIGGATSETSSEGKVSYTLDSEDPVELPRLSAAIVYADVDVAMDWDVAHGQFLEELIYSGIFNSVVLEPRAVVDYGAQFALSRLPGAAMQVQLTFTNMHTGDVIYTGVTRGNPRNGNFGFAYVDGTDTSFEDALAVQTALVEAISVYTVEAVDISGSSIAVLEPLIDDSEVPDDEDIEDYFYSLAEEKFLLVVEDSLFSMTGADIVSRRNVGQAVAAVGVSPDDLFDQEKAGEVGRALGADYVVMSQIGYDEEDDYFLIGIKIVESETLSLFQSSLFESNLWGDEETEFDIATNIDQMFHNRGPRRSATATPRGTSDTVARDDTADTPPTEGQDADGLRTEFGEIALHIDPVFPVLHSYYDENPIGSVTVTNSTNDPVEDIVVSFYVDQYMDNPKASQRIPRLEPNGTESRALYGLFTSEILEITEGARLSALVKVTYTKANSETTEEFVQSIEVLNRNAMTWDDNQKIAAFVTARDPAVMGFARNVSGLMQESVTPGINANLAVAMGLHEGLDTYGMHYVPDPVTSYIEYSEQPTAVDYLLFPRQTLEFHGGDCDDLSALYSALLESVGIDTAFVTTPGHIFVAVSLGIDPERARRTFSHPDELIFRDDIAWLPVEVTLRGEGFLAAWREGAKEWRENVADGRAELYPVHEAWEAYHPVGLPGSISLEPIDREAIGNAFSLEFSRFVNQEIASELTGLEAQKEKDPDNPRWHNRLGSLYGRYGLLPKAMEYFERALELNRDYLPALLNMGNVHFYSGNPIKALEYYEAAQERRPESPDVLLSIARANHELENYGTVRIVYEKIQEVAPEVASKFSYLGLRGEEASRAAQAGAEDLFIWMHESEDE